MIFPGEDGQHFHNFHQAYIADLAPKGALELSMVQEIAHTQWSIARVRAHEASLFALGHEKHADTVQTDGDQTIQAAFAGAAAFKDEAKTIANLGLYLQRHNRMFLATLKALRDIQAVRLAKEQAELDRAIYCASLHELEKLPFTASTFGFLCSTDEIEPLVRRNTFLLSHGKAQRPPVSPPIHVTSAA